MSLIVKVTIMNKANTGCHYLGVVEVTPNGLKETQNRVIQVGSSIEHLCIHPAAAVLLCEGGYDFGDSVAKCDQYKLHNPLLEYLKRDNPTVTLHDELREKLAAAEARAKAAEDRIRTLDGQLAAIKRSFKNALDGGT